VGALDSVTVNLIKTEEPFKGLTVRICVVFFALVIPVLKNPSERLQIPNADDESSDFVSDGLG
jgi:hypothetical protein